MKMLSRRLLAVLGAGLLALAGCGGGGGDSEPSLPPPPAAPTTAVLSGVAATGAPFDGALVTVYDSSGTRLGTTTVALDGSYSVTIPLTAAAPLVVEATRENETLVSAFGETRTTRLNITPLTNLVAARLAPDGNPLSLRQYASVATPAALTAKVAEITALLKPLLDAVGDVVNPLTGTFSANGSGHDKVLDALAVDIRLTATGSNIEVTVKAATAGTVSTTFTNSQATPPAITGTIAVADLPPDNIATMVDDLTTRLTACYAVPFGDRVSGVTAGSTAVVGTAETVIAPACRTLFLDDNPASYLNNGSRVGRDANNNGSFTGIFRSGATGVVFDAGKLEFLRSNATKDPVVSYRTTDSAGNVSNDQLVARVVAGRLKLVGNQYIYNARVRAVVEDREYVNQARASNVTTGYNLFVSNLQDNAGQPVFNRVEVTSPRGTVFIMKPNAGRSAMTVARADGSLSGSSIIYLAARFRDSTTTGTPQQFETGLVFANPAFSEEELRAIPEQGVWSMKFVHADSTKPDVVQGYRTTSRAPTLGEASVLILPRLTDAALAEVRAESQALGYVMFGAPSATSPNLVDFSVNGTGAFWTLPAGARTPTLAQVFGTGPDPDGAGPQPRPRFDDSASLGATARTAVISCTRTGGSDNHCDSSTGVNQYAQGSLINVLQLYVGTPPTEISKVFALYYLFPR